MVAEVLGGKGNPKEPGHANTKAWKGYSWLKHAELGTNLISAGSALSQSSQPVSISAIRADNRLAENLWAAGIDCFNNCAEYWRSGLTRLLILARADESAQKAQSKKL